MMLNARLPTILVPKDEDGLKKICGGYRGDDENYFTFSFSRIDLEDVFTTDLFTLINKEFSLEIDEYEEMIISDNNLVKSILNYLLLIFKKDDGKSLFSFYLERIIFFLKKLWNLIVVLLFSFEGLIR